MADNSIDNLQIEIESTTTDAQRGLTKLKNSLQKLSEMSDGIAKMNSDGISKLKSMAEGVESIANAGNNPGLSKAISELRKLAKIDFSNVGAGSEKLAEVADRVSAVSGNTFVTGTKSGTVEVEPGVDEEDVSDVKRFRQQWDAVHQKATETDAEFDKMASKLIKSTSKVKLLKMELAGLKSKLSEALANGKSSPDSIAHTITQIQKLQAEYKKVTSLSSRFKAAADKLAAPFNKLKKALSIAFAPFIKVGSYIGGKFKNAITGASKKMTGFVRSMARIGLYRTVRFLFSQITAAVKEGTNNIYQYSKAIGGELASSMDRIASSLLYFKNSIGAMVAPLINALAPAIEYVIDKAVALMNVLNQLFAKLSGASTWTKAVKTQTEYAEAAGGAAEAAKSLTAGFDELNVLSDSGSGKGSDMDYGSMFEEVQLGNDFAKWIDQIKEAIANGDWAGVGKILGDKVNELIDKVDFAGIGDKLGYGIQSAFEVLYNFLDTINFDKIGAGIATTLNHMMEQIDFGLVGKTFAKKWTILVDTLYGFATTFDWTKFGLAIADFINGWFEEIDLTKAIQTAQELILGIFESMSQAIRNVEWYKIGTRIMDAIESIDWMSLLGDLGTLLSDAVVGLLDLLLGVVVETDWGKVVQDICAGIGNMLANIEWGEILAKIGALVVDLVVQLPGIIVGALGGIADILGGLFEGFGLDSVAGFFYGIGDAMRSAGTWLKENLVDPVVDWVKDLFGIHSPSTVFAEIGTFLTDGLLQGIADTWHGITEFFSEKLEDIKGFFSTAWENIKTDADSKWDSINTSLSSKRDDIKSGATETFTSIKNSITGIWDGLWGALKRTINSIIGGVEKMANGVINGINAMIKALNKLSFDIPDWVPGLGGKKFGFDLRTVSAISIPRLASGGFPDTGELFIAREAGAEMIGSIGGRTAVANNDQIVEGIKQGVREAMAESGGTHGGSFDVKVYLDGREVTAAVEKRQRERGATIYPGGVLDGV